MIHIAIIDQNKIYRESLKMLLEQIDGFKVVLDSPDGNYITSSFNIPAQIMIIDGSMGKEKCRGLIKHAGIEGRSVKILILAMFREELENDYGQAEVILKSSGKREFEERIKKMLAV